MGGRVRQRENRLLNQIRRPRPPLLAVDVLIVSLDQLVARRLLLHGLPAHGLGLLEELDGHMGVNVGDQVLGADLQVQVIGGGGGAVAVAVGAGAVLWPVVRHVQGRVVAESGNTGSWEL
ncbi:hypothetical protein IMZ48_14330 [Candidatus Bathyarchaeota archaeon]|nr:hypothetical protein [Candidatus Bathyarchaeota archaeon]